MSEGSPARPLRVLVVLGTRPEAIKLAPVIRALQRDPDFEPIVCSTGQHREMLDQVLGLFSIVPDVDLDLMRPNQSLPDVMNGALAGVTRVVAEVQPDLLVVQGDTTTAMAAAYAGYYQRVPVAHVEAGLRSGDMNAPWPEEMNRRAISLLASIHLAPTERAKQTLLGERVSEGDICVTGNTVIDALIEASAVLSSDASLSAALSARYPGASGSRPLVLVTCHRRESWGDPIENVYRAIRQLAEERDVQFIFPVHRNPNAHVPAFDILAGVPNVLLTDPLDYTDFVYLLGRCRFVITDSGGIQEEAPALAKPVLVARDTTERPEGIEAGVARLVGTDRDAIVAAATLLLDDAAAYGAMARAANPYGDGHAAGRAVAFVREWFNRRPDRDERLPAGATAPGVQYR